MSIKATISSSGRVIASAVNIASNVGSSQATFGSPTLNNPTITKGTLNSPTITKGILDCPTFKNNVLKISSPVTFSLGPRFNYTTSATPSLEIGQVVNPSGGAARNVTTTHYGQFNVDVSGGASGAMPTGSGINTDGNIDGRNGTITGDTVNAISALTAPTITSTTLIHGQRFGQNIQSEYVYPVDIRDDVRIRSTGNLYVGGGSYDGLSTSSPYNTPTGRAYFRYSPHMPGFKLTGGNNTPAIRSELGLGIDNLSSPKFKSLTVGVGSQGAAVFALNTFSIAADNLIFNETGLNINAAASGGLAINNGSSGTDFVNADIDTGIFDIIGGLKVRSANTPRLTISSTNSPSIINGIFDGSPTFNGPIRFGSSPGFSYSPKAIAIATKVNFDCPITSTSTISRPVINAEANDTPVRNIQKITALAYAGLSPPDPNTLFIITA